MARHARDAGCGRYRQDFEICERQKTTLNGHRALRKADAQRTELALNGCSAPMLASSSGNHWITSSARSSSDCGIVRSSALATLRFTDSLNTDGRSTGRSAGFAPLRILSTYAAARRRSAGMSVPIDRTPPSVAMAELEEASGIRRLDAQSMTCLRTSLDPASATSLTMKIASALLAAMAVNACGRSTTPRALILIRVTASWAAAGLR